MKRTTRPLRLPVPLRASAPSPFTRRASSTLQHLKDATASPSSPAGHSQPPRDRHINRSEVADEVPWLAKQPLHPLSLADLVK